MKKNKEIDECYQKSIALLEKNSSKFGFLASLTSINAKEQNYLSVFGRDSSISSLGALASGNKKLIAVAKKSIISLGSHQAENGQIPNYFKPSSGKANFWYAGCVDSTIWWLIAINIYERHSKNKIKKTLKKKIDKAISWLYAQEHQNLFLLLQNEASDWGDNMPKEGFVLYTNVLWVYLKRTYRLKNLQSTEKFFNIIFKEDRAVYEKEIKKNQQIPNYTKYMKKIKRPYYLGFLSRAFESESIDVYANILGILLGVIKGRDAKTAINYFLKNKANFPYPVIVTLNPIKKSSKLWKKYMEEYATNFPHLYHNGGIWPFVGGFWIMALAKAGLVKQAAKDLENLAKANSLNNWEFNEWLHGRTGKPMGMHGQTWNAGTYVLAYQILQNKINLF